ncbi:glycosyltransferase [Methanosarcina mazei Go1]|uniref:Glycosyltransferase n=1 Tax=Methanosarcina mazei (strain ATCC BAA-159 / DSM 3647 / Goe1 / Go1 / JCM 11833 / OCM 88) TaxID=192952 RepID=Q8PV72_METMA|nr:glycosyltransferase [Methanosarcina mazei]AAM31798.1 glycosyltransferase [Methanosarcina mazei Go1]WIM42076.1 glycosyltransferase [Methanosarcina mazei]WIM45526.1 glycosyltransferase [Methanosarcina mazei]
MQNIKVSIVIPTKNRASSLKETLESLFVQTYPSNKYEIIVCDDNSSDNTEEIVKDLINNTHNNLRYIKVKSKIEGPAKVRNAGIIGSSGEIIGFTDDDCIVSKNWIETAVECFKKHKEACGVYGTVITVGNCKNKMFRISRRVDVSSDNGSYVTPNVFYKKQTLLDVGLFDTDMRYMQDIELGWRVRKKGPIIFEPSLLVNHKILCASIRTYFRRLKRTEYWVLMYSKHPEHLGEDNLILGHLYNKSPIYITSILLCTGFFLLGSELFVLFLALSVATYLWAHVFVDANYKKYPIRFLMFPRYSATDFIRFIYSLKASIKYKCLVLF